MYHSCYGPCPTYYPAKTSCKLYLPTIQQTGICHIPSRDHDTFKQSGMVASDPLPSGQHTATGQSIPLYNLH